jgi:hypothetical protein
MFQPNCASGRFRFRLFPNEMLESSMAIPLERSRNAKAGHLCVLCRIDFPARIPGREANQARSRRWTLPVSWLASAAERGADPVTDSMSSMLRRCYQRWPVQGSHDSIALRYTAIPSWHGPERPALALQAIGACNNLTSSLHRHV